MCLGAAVLLFLDILGILLVRHSQILLFLELCTLKFYQQNWHLGQISQPGTSLPYYGNPIK
jgi:hypothetical protein